MLVGIVLIAIVAIVGFISVTWPQFFFPVFGLCWVACAVLDVRNKYRTINVLGEQYDQIAPGESQTFVGLYRPHWEIGRIQIAMTKRWLGFIPAFESWKPYFVAEFPIGYDVLDNENDFLIRFVGTPTERGQFGHMGIMCREICITEIVDVQPLPKNAV